MGSQEARVDVHRGDVPLRVDAQLGGQGRPLGALQQARGLAGQGLREHVQHAAGEVDAGAALAGLGIHRRALGDEAVDVGDGDQYSQCTIGAGREGRQGVVDVGGRGRVDGDGRHLAQVATRAQTRAGRGGQARDLQHLGRIGGPQAVADHAALQPQVGVGRHLAQRLHQIAADGRHHESPVRQVLGRPGGEGPVGVGHRAIDLEQALLAARGDAAEQLGPAALHQLQVAGAGPAVLGDAYQGAGQISLEEGVQVGRGDEGCGLALRFFQGQEAESPGVDADSAGAADLFRHGGTLHQMPAAFRRRLRTTSGGDTLPA